MVNFSCNFSVWNQVKEVVNHFQVMKMFQMDFSDRQTNNQCYPKTTVPLTEIWSHIQHMLSQDVLGHLARSLNTWLSRWKWIALYFISCLVMCTNQNLKFEPLILVSKQLLPSARRFSTIYGKTGRQSFSRRFPVFLSHQVLEIQSISDACCNGINQIFYLSIISQKNKVHLSFFMMRSRVSPLKLIFIPHESKQQLLPLSA